MKCRAKAYKAVTWVGGLMIHDGEEETPTREHLMRRVAFYAGECERQGKIIERQQAEIERLMSALKQIGSHDATE